MVVIRVKTFYYWMIEAMWISDLLASSVQWPAQVVVLKGFQVFQQEVYLPMLKVPLHDSSARLQDRKLYQYRELWDLRNFSQQGPFSGRVNSRSVVIGTPFLWVFTQKQVPLIVSSTWMLGIRSFHASGLKFICSIVSEQTNLCLN